MFGCARVLVRDSGSRESASFSTFSAVDHRFRWKTSICIPSPPVFLSRRATSPAGLRGLSGSRWSLT